MSFEYVDVAEKGELGPAPEGVRYLDFLGGTKEIRCYLVPHDMPRATFMARHADLLDPALQPIYSFRGLTVTQDASWAVPGFYVVAFQEHFPSLDVVDPVLHLRAAHVIARIRHGMRRVLRIRYIHMHYEEKPGASCNVHYWLLPISDPETGRTEVITRLDLRAYLRRFKFSERRQQIYSVNDAMRGYVASCRLSELDAALEEGLQASRPRWMLRE